MSSQLSSNKSSHSRQLGFTLVELLTTVAIVGISLGIGVPNLQNFLQDNHQLNAMNEFSSYVTYARNEAVVRNTTVTLCVANSTKTDCDTTGTNWANGYVVMAKGITSPLKIHDKLPGKQTITGGNSLVFSGNGLLNSAGSLNFCDSRSPTARSVTINMGSQVRRSNSSVTCSSAT
jgi:type IV fimbrial biogenesis protein FimT